MSEAIERFGEAREVGAALQDVHGPSSWAETLAGMLPFLAFGLGMIIYEILPRDLLAGPIGFWCYLVLYIIGVIGLGIGWVLARFHEWPSGPRSRGAYIFAVGLNNMGHTGGAVVCFAFLGEEALAQSVVLLLHWQFLVYLICFPLAKHWSDAHERLSPLRELVAALRDPRLLPLVGLLAGLLVNVCGVSRPDALRPVAEWAEDSYPG